MDDKLKIYFPLVDIYKMNTNSFSYVDESDPVEVKFFKEFTPFFMDMLMKYLENIIYLICKNLKEKQKVIKEIEYIKTLVNTSQSNTFNFTKYMWKNINLIELIKGDYFYLKKNFIINTEFVPDNESYINDFSYPGTIDKYPFTLKDLYRALVERGIYVTIDNYYSDYIKTE